MTLWIYSDARGVRKIGTVERSSDRGGTDVTYFFRSEDGALDVLRGSQLNNAHALHTPQSIANARREVDLVRDLGAG